MTSSSLELDFDPASVLFLGVKYPEKLTEAEIDIILAHSLYPDLLKNTHWGYVTSFFDKLTSTHLLKMLMDPATNQWVISERNSQVFWSWARSLLYTALKYPRILPQLLRDKRCKSKYKINVIARAVKQNRESLRILLKEPDVREYLSRPHNLKDECPLRAVVSYNSWTYRDRGDESFNAMQIIMTDSEIRICDCAIEQMLKEKNYRPRSSTTEKKLWNVIISRAQGDEFE